MHLSSLFFQPVSLSDREVISRLRNCLLALAAHKVLMYDTSVLYCYESSLQHQVGSTFELHPLSHKCKTTATERYPDKKVDFSILYCAIWWPHWKTTAPGQHLW